MRRLHGDDRLRRQAGEHGRQQPQFTDAGLLCQQLNEATRWPAAAGQLCRQRRVACVDTSRAGLRQLVGAPQVWVDAFRMSESGVHVRAPILYGYTGLADCNPAISKSQRGNCTSWLTVRRTPAPRPPRRKKQELVAPGSANDELF
ncbi:hypothetical protein DM48_7836 [Burkholderia gladioli]|uniref:Uncharacterized protein n=1 Tax=Burkholderia gladioli TaxID=28095 RepID=A0AAW3FCJ4_BURGA|nr:hypothetical protein DM48_7836 [Burkholderia gladioli]